METGFNSVRFLGVAWPPMSDQTLTADLYGGFRRPWKDSVTCVWWNLFARYAYLCQYVVLFIWLGEHLTSIDLMWLASKAWPSWHDGPEWIPMPIHDCPMSLLMVDCLNEWLTDPLADRPMHALTVDCLIRLLADWLLESLDKYIAHSVDCYMVCLFEEPRYGLNERLICWPLGWRIGCVSESIGKRLLYRILGWHTSQQRHYVCAVCRVRVCSPRRLAYRPFASMLPSLVAIPCCLPKTANSSSMRCSRFTSAARTRSSFGYTAWLLARLFFVYNIGVVLPIASFRTFFLLVCRETQRV